MTARRGQIAIFVLVGLIVLLGIIITIVALRQQTSDVVSDSQDIVEGDVELAAEQARMQQRVDECLGQLSAEVIDDYRSAGLVVEENSQTEDLIAQEISDRFPDCFFRFNTAQKLTIGDSDPVVEVTLGNNALFTQVKYPVTGELDDKTYRLSDFQASTETNLQDEIEETNNLRNSLLGDSPDVSALLDPVTCDYDPYGMEEQGYYSDLIIYDDGSMDVLLYDYNDWNPRQPEPEPTIAPLPACTPQV